MASNSLRDNKCCCWFTLFLLPFLRHDSLLSHRSGLRFELHPTYIVATVDDIKEEKKKTTLLAKSKTV